MLITREAIFHALRLMLQAARVQRNRAIGLRKPMRGFFDILRRNTRHLRGRLRIPVASTDSFTASKPVVCCRDEFAVLQAIAQNHVEHAHQEREIRPRAHRQKQIGVAR